MKKSLIMSIVLVFLLSGCKYLTPIVGTYDFASTVPEYQQRDFILENEKMIVHLKDLGILEDEELKYYSSYYELIYRNDKTGEVGVPVTNFGVKAILATFTQIYPDFANYGVMYGFANYIAKDTGNYSQGLGHTKEELIEFLTEYPDVMELGYPLFIPEYTTPLTTFVAEEYATVLMDYVVNEYGVEAVDEFLKSEDSDFVGETYYKWVEEFNEFYGLPEYKPDHYILFSRYGDEYLLKWVTSNANWYLHEFHYDTFFYGLDFEFFKKEYFSTINLIRQLENEMERVTSVLDLEDIEYPKINIYLVKSSHAGFYRDDKTWLNTIFSLSHEYIHHLQSEFMDDTDEWLKESMAIYYSQEYEYSSKYFGRLFNLKELQEPLAEALAGFRIIYGEKAVYNEDVYEFADVYVYVNNGYDSVLEEYTNESYFQYISFTNYVINTYGEETYLEAVRDDKNEVQYFGKTWETILADWENYIRTKY